MSALIAREQEYFSLMALTLPSTDSQREFSSRSGAAGYVTEEIWKKAGKSLKKSSSEIFV